MAQNILSISYFVFLKTFFPHELDKHLPFQLRAEHLETELGIRQLLPGRLHGFTMTTPLGMEIHEDLSTQKWQEIIVVVCLYPLVSTWCP